MGIDFDWRRQPAAVRAAQQRFLDELAKQPLDPHAWNPDGATEQAMTEYSQADNDAGSSFSVNWSAWQQIFDAMDDRGMVAHVGPPPEPNLLALGWDGGCGYEALFDEAIPDAAADAIDDWLSVVPSAPGIAAYKVTGNNFWLITPEECQSALDALGDQPAPDFGDWDGWERWIAFLRGAIDHGGARVS